MDKKAPKKNWQLLTEDESRKLLTHFYGCLGIIVLLTLLLYWLFEMVKAGI